MRMAVSSAAWLSIALLSPGVGGAAADSGPVLGRTVVVERVSGVVLVRVPGAPVAVPLTTRRVIPVGSTLDATAGTVRLTAATAPRLGTQSGLFDGGAFIVTQQRSTLTQLTLVGGNGPGLCAGSSRGAPVTRGPRRAARAAAASTAILRVLHGRARGRFRTVGRYAAAGIRGTDWVTADRCDGTFLSDNQGRVETASRNGAIKSPTLSAGDSSVYRCAQHGLAPVSASYCVAVEGFVQHTVLNGKPAVLHKYVAALATKSPAGERTELCITTPSLMTSCTQYPLAPPDPSGYRSSTVGCYATEGGDYTITYRLDGVQLGAPLVYHSPAASSVAATCEASLGKPDPGIFSSPLATNLKAVNRYVLPTPAIVGFEDIYLGPGVSSGRQLIRGVVYADTNGAPGRLLDSTEQLVYTRARGKRWAVLNFNPYLPLPAGVYWIGLISGGTPGVAAFYSDHVAGVLDINRNAYAQGPSDPFGPFVRGANLISLYLDYLVGTETAK